MAEKLTDHAFMKIIPFNQLDTEQFMTVKRKADEWEKAYSKQWDSLC